MLNRHFMSIKFTIGFIFIFGFILNVHVGSSTNNNTKQKKHSNQTQKITHHSINNFVNYFSIKHTISYLGSTNNNLNPQFRHQFHLRDNNFKSGNDSTKKTKSEKRMVRDLACAAKKTYADFKFIYTAPTRLTSKGLLYVGGILSIGGILFKYDQDIYNTIKRNQNHKYYKPIRKTGEFFEPLGYMGFTNKYIFASLLIGYVIDYKPMVNISFDLLEHFLVASLGKNLLMISAGRKGPMIGEGPRSFKFNDGRSMPSGHSLAIMQMASVFAYHIDYLPFKIIAYSIAGTVLLQRISSDHHWPSDVYAGALFGYIVSHSIFRFNDETRLKVSPTTWNNGKAFGLVVSAKF
jgi:membrane-associated phospholipid phosphatase